MTGRGEHAGDVVAATLRAAELVGTARHLPPADLERTFFRIVRDLGEQCGLASEESGVQVASMVMTLARFTAEILDEWSADDPDAAETWLSDVVAGIVMEAERRRDADG